jgi:hypothetical protein
MKVRILTEPTGTVSGASLENYRVGCSYDLPAPLAEYLIVEGFARIEMRKNDRGAFDHSRGVSSHASNASKPATAFRESDNSTVKRPRRIKR